MYRLCVALGIVLAFAARRRDADPPIPHRFAISLIAAIGAIAGAFLFELPADYFGWTTGIAGAPIATHAIGGRTVVGGLLGGWIAVEAGKWGLGVRRSTGDGFGLPLAIGLAFGRLGCFFNGCCAGRVVRPTDTLHALARPGHDGLLRYPSQLLEVGFHATAAALLYVAARRGVMRDLRFATYIATYAVFRFGLEFLRDNPPVLGGLSYYQWLTIPLFAIAAGTGLVRVARRSGAIDEGETPQMETGGRAV